MLKFKKKGKDFPQATFLPTKRNQHVENTACAIISPFPIFVIQSFKFFLSKLEVETI